MNSYPKKTFGVVPMNSSVASTNKIGGTSNDGDSTAPCFQPTVDCADVIGYPVKVPRGPLQVCPTKAAPIDESLVVLFTGSKL